MPIFMFVCTQALEQVIYLVTFTKEPNLSLLGKIQLDFSIFGVVGTNTLALVAGGKKYLYYHYQETCSDKILRYRFLVETDQKNGRFTQEQEEHILWEV